MPNSIGFSDEEQIMRRAIIGYSIRDIRLPKKKIIYLNSDLMKYPVFYLSNLITRG